MLLLLIGVVLWSFVHLYPALMPESRNRWHEKLGENPYKGLFSVGIIAGLALIVIGWRSIVPAGVYAPPLGPTLLIAMLMMSAFILFAASAIPGNIRRFVRHPQMTAVILWGSAHLLANGSNRAVILFGGLTLWAVLEIVLINKRDGQWQKPEKAAVKLDAITIGVGVVLYFALAYFHKSLFGVPVLPL
ncbi:MAG: NnrU family protein [Gammaproteobacteria bacterium]|nr:NnrU family protein [Gammaproteobacteria bacterium]